MTRRFRVTTFSGAEYLILGNRVIGGSKNLKNGRLVNIPRVGEPLLIQTPERLQVHPNFVDPHVVSSYVVKIEALCRCNDPAPEDLETIEDPVTNECHAVCTACGGIVIESDEP